MKEGRMVFIFMLVLAVAGCASTGTEVVKEGLSIEDLYGQKGSLDGETVEIAGTIVKVSPSRFTIPQLEGEYWFHIQDRTGDPEAGTDDLAVVYSGIPSLAEGGHVVVRGRVNTDVDLGGGYFYQVLVDNATVTKNPMGGQ